METGTWFVARRYVKFWFCNMLLCFGSRRNPKIPGAAQHLPPREDNCAFSHSWMPKSKMREPRLTRNNKGEKNLLRWETAVRPEPTWFTYQDNVENRGRALLATFERFLSQDDVQKNPASISTNFAMILRNRSYLTVMVITWSFSPSDINECSVGSHRCVSTVNGGQCTNTIGSYSCICVSGYSGNGVQVGMTVGAQTGTGCTGKFNSIKISLTDPMIIEMFTSFPCWQMVFAAFFFFRGNSQTTQRDTLVALL